MSTSADPFGQDPFDPFAEPAAGDPVRTPAASYHRQPDPHVTRQGWPNPWAGIDTGVSAAILALLVIGLVLSLAASPFMAERKEISQPFYFTFRHAKFAGGAFVTLLFCAALSVRLVRRGAALLFLTSFLMLVLVRIMGDAANGATRWLDIAGFRMQPSEFMKPAVIVICGWLLAQRDIYAKGPWTLAAFLFFAVSAGLILIQPDVGQTVLLTVTFMATFFVSGLPLLWALGMTVGAAGLGVVLYQAFPYVRERFAAHANKEGADRGQIEASLQAFDAGGLLGVGPGQSTTLSNLPESHNDFIFAVAAEEFGAIGCLVIVALFAFIVVRGLWLAAQVDDGYRRAAASGLFVLFGTQAAINMMVNVELIPTKGMTLPLLSNGGSSMIGSALTLGLALALTRRDKARNLVE